MNSRKQPPITLASEVGSLITLYDLEINKNLVGVTYNLIFFCFSLIWVSGLVCAHLD